MKPRDRVRCVVVTATRHVGTRQAAVNVLNTSACTADTVAAAGDVDAAVAWCRVARH